MSDATRFTHSIISRVPNQNILITPAEHLTKNTVDDQVQTETIQVCFQETVHAPHVDQKMELVYTPLPWERLRSSLALSSYENGKLHSSFKSKSKLMFVLVSKWVFVEPMVELVSPSYLISAPLK